MERVGTVSAVCGRVTAVDTEGQVRVLRVHEPVHADETLIAALDSAANVRLHSGMELYLAPGMLVTLDTDVFEYDESADDGSLCLTDVQRMLCYLNQPACRSVA